MFARELEQSRLFRYYGTLTTDVSFDEQSRDLELVLFREMCEGIHKDAQHLTDPNPVHWRHVYAQLEQNFPAEAIEWVKRGRWIGPVNIPWSRIDDDDIGSWAASHQPDAVNRFARNIKAGTGHTNPSILVQEPGTNRAFIVDGHHRALARRKLGMPVLAYVGNIDPGDREAAEETHSSQVHAGSDPGNR